MHNNQSGQSLLEVVTASAVGILVVSALTYATIFSLRNATFAKNSAQATKLAQEGIERVRTLRDRDGQVNYTISTTSSTSKFSDLWQSSVSLSCEATCYFYFSTDSTEGVLIGADAWETVPPNFKRRFQIEDEGTNHDQKKVTVIVQWTDFAGTHESRLTTILRKI